MLDNHFFVERQTNVGWEPAGLGTPFPDKDQARIWLDQHGWEGERFRVIQVVEDVVVPSATKKVG
jgi:hypothetical protein